MPDPNARARAIVQEAKRSIHREEQVRQALAKTFPDFLEEANQQLDTKLDKVSATSNKLQALIEQLKKDPPTSSLIPPEDSVFANIIDGLLPTTRDSCNTRIVDYRQNRHITLRLPAGWVRLLSRLRPQEKVSTYIRRAVRLQLKRDLEQAQSKGEVADGDQLVD